MRLKKILISGFKSFVDLSDIRFPSSLVGVVGPNGCGKSNVIDAVRWVMGESSAKTLRGDNMEDVIFNGSTKRKPVSKASVELIFDNNEGKVPGHYGQFSEIAVKRTLTRDGQSVYQINKIRTRRKDVLELFMGTGLGPRSYSIIEQGTVSRIIEARPEDLRAFVEEAAGTSKYKSRRRETENRMENVRENLERLDGIRKEKEKQLKRLKDQSETARRYKDLKEHKRTLNNQLQTLRLAHLNHLLSAQDRLSAEQSNRVESARADQRRTEAEMERINQQREEVQSQHDGAQKEHYEAVARVRSVEQEIDYRRKSEMRNRQEAERLQAEQAERRAQIDADRKRCAELRERLDSLQEDIQDKNQSERAARDGLDEAERALGECLNEMDAVGEDHRRFQQQMEIQRSRLQYLQDHNARSIREKQDLQSRIDLADRQSDRTDVEALRAEVKRSDRSCSEAESGLLESEREHKVLLDNLEQKRQERSMLYNQLHEIRSRADSLREIRSLELVEADEVLADWLKQQGLDMHDRLANDLSVEVGWGRALDRVLGGFHGAVPVREITASMLRSLPDSSISLFIPAGDDAASRREGMTPLLDHVVRPRERLAGLLDGIYAADSVEQALDLRGRLGNREIVVTRDGTLMGASWISYSSRKQLKAGFSAREEEIDQLERSQRKIETGIAGIEQSIGMLEDERSGIEQALKIRREELSRLRSANAELHTRFAREDATMQEVLGQREKMRAQFKEAEARIESICGQITAITASEADAASKVSTLGFERQQHQARREQLEQQVKQKRGELHAERDAHHRIELVHQQHRSEIGVLEESLRRLQAEQARANARVGESGGSPDEPEESLADLETRLKEQIAAREAADERFEAVQVRLSDLEEELKGCREHHAEAVDRVNRRRGDLEQQQLVRQEAQVRRDTHLESVTELGFDISACEAELPEAATVDAWDEKLEVVSEKITRLGPVNLVAMEEYAEEARKKSYLDEQHADLVEALETLEGVMRKIDRESRTRFRDTFERINTSFSGFFPTLFGGGRAELVLNSDDYLTAGISVIARPPGKHNSHIHLLSGGEKALTAVALLFSFFELNPSPFCMLDEVDASLDDANVARYCETLQQLSRRSQMIIVTHNKTTMESMEHLVGVTMAEAGVSRMVSVDVKMAAGMMGH